MKERSDNHEYKQTAISTEPTTRVMFQPKCGYCTGQVRLEYIRQMHDRDYDSTLDQNKKKMNGSRWYTKKDDHSGTNDHDCSENTTTATTIDEKKEEESDDIPTESLIANPDITQPLYFWQLYSILGREPILNIIRDFYTSIHKGIDTTTSMNQHSNAEKDDEDEKWFRHAFTSSSCCMLTTSSSSSGKEKSSESSYIEQAIQAHASYWIDVFGGGDVFHGGEYRLEFTHKYYATPHVMNARGAKLWMKHMKRALRKNLHPDNHCSRKETSPRGPQHNGIHLVPSSKFSSGYNDIIHHDPRILSCIMDFLRTKMKQFSVEYGWVLDESDFVIDDFGISG